MIRIDTKNIRISLSLYVFTPNRVQLSKIPIHEYLIGYKLFLVKPSILKINVK